MYENDPLTEAIIGAALRVRTEVGVGLLESAYQASLLHEFAKLKLNIVSQKGFPVMYDGVQVKVAFRPDFVIENKVIVELKTVTNILPVHRAQLLTYLRLSRIRVGLIINFHAVPFSNGLVRMVL